VSYAGTAEAILRDGYACVQLSGAERDSLVGVRKAAAEFFGLGEAVKLRHGSDDFNFGFRPFGRQFSVTPDRPDMCESFAYWSDDPELIPHHDEIGSFISALGAYRATVGEVTTAILHELAAHYSYRSAIEFEPASYLEINWYMNDPGRDLLQDRHEDGHLLSFVAPDRPGLEIEVNGQMQAPTLRDGEVVVMPGAC
jgi:isopenicillin N synthase-like dioxygenase